MDLAFVRRWWPLAAVIGLLLVTSVAATRSAPQLDRVTPRTTATTTAPPLLPPTVRPSVAPPTETPVEAARGLPDWIGTATTVVLALVVAAMVVILTMALLRDANRRRKGRTGRRDPRRAGRTAEDLVAALDAGLEELSDADRDPRRAVIACWVRLEQAAAEAGTPRHPGDSPTDLIGRLLAEQQVDAAVLAALMEVYREARYATHTVDDQMRQQARYALERLRADLGAEVVA